MAKTHPYISVAPRLSLFDEVAIRPSLCMFMAIWQSHILVFVELFLRYHCVAVAPWLILFDRLAAIRLILVPVFLALWLCGWPYESQCGFCVAAGGIAHLPDARAGPEFKSRRKKS